jgi:hypothetical protein
VLRLFSAKIDHEVDLCLQIALLEIRFRQIRISPPTPSIIPIVLARVDALLINEPEGQALLYR